MPNSLYNCQKGEASYMQVRRTLIALISTVDKSIGLLQAFKGQAKQARAEGVEVAEGTEGAKGAKVKRKKSY
jgi:hypothetical protein